MKRNPEILTMHNQLLVIEIYIVELFPLPYPGSLPVSHFGSCSWM